MITSIATIVLIMFLYMTGWFLLAMLRKRNDLADVAWGIGFIVVAGTSLLLSETPSGRGILVFCCVLLWGARLALHIGLRNRSKGEDHRYRQWREEWGEHFVIRSYLQVFLLQGVLLLLVSAPVILVTGNSGPPLDYAVLPGLAVWLFGFVFETVGDYQLACFKRRAENKGRIMRYGLWRYTRHPNYFGEVTLWWGIWLMALPLPGGWLSIIGPLTITFLILKVSGIPLLERKYQGNPEFEEYKRQTSAFWPLPPKE